MLSIKEMQQVNEAVDQFHETFSPEDLDKAEYYDIDEDPATLMTTITLYDGDANVIATFSAEDWDVAVALVSDEFDLEDIDDYEGDPSDAASNSRYGHA